ncbi:MAG: hypothetical protein Q9M32_04290 [Sulfurimonas sp.]|nr:hypothetical protein [Sulfurimonas sp.]
MIDIRLFKFDSKTDYLPYYKNYSIERDTVTTLDDILNKINAIEKFGYISDGYFFLRANNTYTSSKASLDDVLQSSLELTLEPLSINRAVNDLIIDTKDYQKKFNLLDAYISESEKETLIKDKMYMLEYYASNTLHFENDYVGEHVILLGLDIVKKDESLKNEIFEVLSCENGIQSKSSLKHRILNYPPLQKIEKEKLPEIVQSFSNFNIALYCGLNTPSFEGIITQSDAHYIDLASKYFDIPLNIQKLSYLMAGTILLEAFDNNADFLIVYNANDLVLFDAQQKAIEKVMGREINLPVLTRNEFVGLLQGEKNKNTLALNTHKIKINFLG